MTSLSESGIGMYVESEVKLPSKVTLMTGVENTYMWPFDTDHLHTMDHLNRFAEDLSMIRELGVTDVRCPVPWHNIEQQKGTYDWSWTDQYLEAYQQYGLNPIVDMVHHTSVPREMNESFADPDFAKRHQEFVLTFAERYPWVRDYTLINEPTATSDLCGGWWHPKRDSSTILKHMTQTMCSTSEALAQLNPDIRIFHTDPVVHHQATDPQHQEEVDFLNSTRRFMAADLMFGLITQYHPLYDHLIQNGYTESELEWFTQHPAKVDVFAMDYYYHCEQLKGDIMDTAPPAIGMAAVMKDYIDRYKSIRPDMKFAVGETNACGTNRDRINWFHHTIEQGELLQKQLGETLAFCWYPAIDCTGWKRGLNKRHRRVDPQGVISLDRRNMRRHPTEFTDIFTKYATNELDTDNIPVYPFSQNYRNPPVRLQHFMEHWSQNPFSDLSYFEAGR